jgi:dienelactone hydrolase
VQADREIPRDNYGALAYLRTRPDVKPNNIAILGQSFGASSMFYTIADGARPKELTAEQDFRVAIAFYPGFPPFLAREPKWKPRQQLLFLMGEADDFTPPRALQKTTRLGGSKRRAVDRSAFDILAPITPSIIPTFLSK